MIRDKIGLQEREPATYVGMNDQGKILAGREY